MNAHAQLEAAAARAGFPSGRDLAAHNSATRAAAKAARIAKQESAANAAKRYDWIRRFDAVRADLYAKGVL